ncbi:MAG TPA: hypothetical protein VEI53_09810 [Ktedonobacteraceae bacterium]|nr:hypothetical protein [Ktedonobacteraceae bacterium]
MSRTGQSTRELRARKAWIRENESVTTVIRNISLVFLQAHKHLVGRMAGESLGDLQQLVTSRLRRTCIPSPIAAAFGLASASLRASWTTDAFLL